MTELIVVCLLAGILFGLLYAITRKIGKLAQTNAAMAKDLKVALQSWGTFCEMTKAGAPGNIGHELVEEMDQLIAKVKDIRKNSNVRPTDGGCWYCQTKKPGLVFSGEFDTYVHQECIKARLKEEPSDPEAMIMAKEFSLHEYLATVYHSQEEYDEANRGEFEEDDPNDGED